MARKVHRLHVHNSDGLVENLLGCGGQIAGIVGFDFCGTVLVWHENVKNTVVNAFHPHPEAKSVKFARAYQGAGDRVDPLIERNLVLIKACDQAAHPRRYLVLPVLQNDQERVAQGRRSSPDSNSLLDEKGSDLIDRRCSPRDQTGANAVAGLEIELVLCLLAHGTQLGRRDASAIASASL